jgi:hypothetical protein
MKNKQFFYTFFLFMFTLFFLGGWIERSCTGEAGSSPTRLQAQAGNRPKKQARVNWFTRALHSAKVINFTFALF